MRLLRLFIRLLFICLITLVHILFIALCFPLKYVFTHYALVVGYITHSWGAFMMMLTGEVDIQGPIPQPPFYLTSNHLSYADIWVLLAALRATFIAKHDLGSWPIIRSCYETHKNYFINRTKKIDVSQ